MTRPSGGGLFRPGPAEFARLATRGNLVPVCLEIPADLLTPVAASLRLAHRARHHFLLESVEGGEILGRYSFLGRDPFCIVKGHGGRCVIHEQGREREALEGPLAALQSIATRYRPVFLPDMPRFCGGGVGYLSYDTIRLRESIPFRVTDDLNLPDVLFGFYDTVVAFDHVKQRILIVSMVRTEEEKGSLRTQYGRAQQKIRVVEKCLMQSRPLRVAGPKIRKGKPRSATSEADYKRAVQKARSAIRSGEIFQVVLSQRFEQRCASSPFGIYRALRRLNPSPYHFYLHFPEVALAGASPEMLVRVEGTKIQTRPIAGTRRRGRNSAEDLRLEAELLADPKERAEHLMLVDLGRNDLGRVCRYDSIRIKEFMGVERFSHVMHLVSTLEGTLRARLSPLEALMSCFPAGTVTGAPKVRAMELIDELERLKRGPYAGVVGYVDFSGNLDTCINIRTAVMKGSSAFMQTGAGIVADSKPAREQQECLSKAQVLFAALREAEGIGG